MKLDAPVTKKAALAAGVPVVQLATLKTAESQQVLSELEADVFVVVAFGLILPAAVLEIPRLGCVNVHFSLLPLLRGAAPVQWAIIEGHRFSGVTIMQMDPGMDTGPILAGLQEPIKGEDNTETLEARLADVGAELLIQVLGDLEHSRVRPEPQDDSLATYAPKISAEDAHLDWSLPCEQIVNRVRGLTPRPGAWSTLGSRRLKVWKVAKAGERSNGAPGLVEVTPEGLLLAHTGTGAVEMLEVQPEGKSKMSGAEFVRGYRPALDALLT